MKEPVWVLKDLVIAVQQMLLAEHGGLPGLRDENLLDSALAKPQQQNSYAQNSTVFQLAAAYSYGLSSNHPFVDGNKRVALTVAAVFLQLNGYALNATEAEAVLAMQALAAGKLDESTLAKWYADFSHPLPSHSINNTLQ